MIIPCFLLLYKLVRIERLRACWLVISCLFLPSSILWTHNSSQYIQILFSLSSRRNRPAMLALEMYHSLCTFNGSSITYNFLYKCLYNYKFCWCGNMLLSSFFSAFSYAFHHYHISQNEFCCHQGLCKVLEYECLDIMQYVVWLSCS